MPSLPPIFFDASRNWWKIEIKIFPYCTTSQENCTLSIIYFFHHCLWKQLFASNSSQSLSNIIFWTILVTTRLFTQFQFKIRASKLLKSAKSCLTWWLPIFSLRSKFGIKRLLSLVQDVFQKNRVNSSQNMTVFNIGAVNKNIKSKRKFCRQSWT